MKRNTFLEQSFPFSMKGCPQGGVVRDTTHEVQLTPHKAEGRNVGVLATILILAVFATACDPGFNEDMVIRNASSHTVTVVPAPYSYYNSMLDSTLTLTHETYTIAPNEEVVIEVGGGIGAASFELGVWAFMDYYSDSVTFRFAGETDPQVVYYRSDTTGISPFNFNSMNYQYEEDVNNGLIFHGHRSYGKLTFTITDEHYEEAETDEHYYEEAKR